MNAPLPIRRVVILLRSVVPFGILALCSIAQLSLSACTATKSGTTIGGPQLIQTSKAMIMPAPGSASVLSVIEERFSNAVAQKVVLSTSSSVAGQNYLSIQMFGPMERETQGTRTLNYRPVAASALLQEARSAVPGVAMKISSLFLRNTYGPFGYAFGQSSEGDSCIYGWQQLRSSEAERSNFRNVGAVQVRLRLCETAASEKELLSVMYGYTITGSFYSYQWNPYGGPRPADNLLSAGEPIYPNDTELSQAPKVLEKRPAHLTSSSRENALPEDLELSPEEQPARRMVRVPSPMADDTGKLTPDTSVVVPTPGCLNSSGSCD